MTEGNIESVSILGSGNVASWFVFVLKKAKIPIRQIYSRNLEHCQKLAEACGAKAINNLTEIEAGSDLYLFSVCDDSYEKIVSEIPFQMPLACLTAGSVSQKVLKPHADRFGVLYPCQSISKNADFANLTVPLCVEGNSEDTAQKLFQLAEKLSDKVYFVNEAQRAVLHLAAVFANNFTNMMYGISFNLMQKGNIPKELLIPLMQNTLDKIQTMTPQEAQTGPARRGDCEVLRKHEEMLSDDMTKEVYRACSEWLLSSSKTRKENN